MLTGDSPPIRCHGSHTRVSTRHDSQAFFAANKLAKAKIVGINEVANCVAVEASCCCWGLAVTAGAIAPAVCTAAVTALTWSPDPQCPATLAASVVAVCTTA